MLFISTRTHVRPAATLAIAILTTLATTTALLAQDADQTDTNTRLLACDAIVDTMEKLACFDAVVKSLEPGPGLPPVATAAPLAGSEAGSKPAVSVSNAEDSSAEASRATPTAPSDVAAPAATSDTTAPVVATTAPAASTTQTSTVAVAAATTATVAESSSAITPDASRDTSAGDEASMSVEDSFGIEGVKSEEARKVPENSANELKSIEATIVEAWPTIDGRFEARLDNGQVWRETELTRTSRLPKAGTPVVISKRRLGSYRMKLGNNNRLAAVRRTK